MSRMDEDRALVARQLIQIAEELDRAVPGVQLLIAGGGNVFRELKEQAEAEKEELMGALEAKDEEIRLLKSDQARAAAADQRILRIKRSTRRSLKAPGFSTMSWRARRPSSRGSERCGGISVIKWKDATWKTIPTVHKNFRFDPLLTFPGSVIILVIEETRIRDESRDRT